MTRPFLLTIVLLAACGPADEPSGGESGGESTTGATSSTSASASSTSLTAGESSTSESGDPSTCAPAPACTDVELEAPLLRGSGWAQGADGEPITIFVSDPGTGCGDVQPDACTGCGNYESVSIVLPAELQAPGTYALADGLAVECGRWISDCAGNGGDEGGPTESYSLTITRIDGDCIVGEVVGSDRCSTGSFAVSRCPS